MAANIASFDSDAISVAEQDAIIKQTVIGEAVASADQDSTISQGDDDAGGAGSESGTSSDSSGSASGDSGSSTAG